MVSPQNTFSPKKKERFSWWNHITLHARNATTIILFIVTAKILTAIRSISAETAIINLHPNARGRRGQIAGGSIRLALCAEKQVFYITIMSIIPITVVVTRSVTILSLNGSPLPLPLHLCHPFLESIILSVCVIPYKLLLWLCQCFILAKTLSAISV